MIDILTPSLTHNHLMCSQSGNIQDLAGHSPTSVFASDPEPDSSNSRQDYANQQTCSDMGLRYMTIPNTDDVRYTQDSGTSHSPVYSIESTVPNTSSSSSLAFPPYNLYQPPLSNSTYNSAGSTYFSPAFSLSSMPDIKPRLGPIHSSPGIASLSRSPQGLPHLGTPISTRDLYTSTTPHYRRSSDLLSRSPTLSSLIRSPLSPSTSGFTSPLSTMDSALSPSASAPVPPLFATEVLYTIQTSDGQIVRPEIFGRIDKGFFLADSDWTCYRRNYFSLNCSYTLQPAIPNGTMYLVQSGGAGPAIHAFAMCIGAVVDGRDGKSIELVQHTPKRDKGPQEKPTRQTLSPRPPHPSGGHSLYGSDPNRSSLYDTQSFSTNPNQPSTEATFERIQFKNATANNGKRRAAQQYYHILVELFVDLGSHYSGERWVKIASRMSAPMVVRGRSPGHYQNERRGSNTSSGGPGGSAGGYTPSASMSRTPGDGGMGMGGMHGSSGVYNDYRGGASSGGHYSRAGLAPLNVPMEPTLSSEEAKSIECNPGYLYYPASIYEGHESRYGGLQRPNPVKTEYGSGYTLPSLSGVGDGNGGWGRNCGRFEGVEGSKGYFPTGLVQHELNIT